MNVGNILKVADAIEQASVPDLGFNMNVWNARADTWGVTDLSGHNCKTVACVGGWTCAVFGFHRHDDFEAADALGLTNQEAHLLFYPSGEAAYTATPAQAAACLRHLAETGEVNWPRALASS